MPQKDSTALRKRQQIAQSNKTMFLWVAGASVIVGIAIVVSWFLIQKMAFNQKVINEKADTIATLRTNNEAIVALKDNIRVLETNEALNSIKASEDDKALQVVLDALPADANSLALGASLQKKFIEGIDGLTLESLTVDPVMGIESSEEEGYVPESDVPAEENSISFRLTVSSRDANALKELLTRFEKSIRVMQVRSLNLERTENRLTLAIEGSSYYEPARSIELKDKVVKP